MKKRKKKRLKGLFLTFTFAFLMPLLLFLVINEFVLKTPTFNNGFTLFGVDISNLTSLQAKERIESVFNENTKGLNIKINYLDKSWQFGEEDFEIRSNLNLVLEELNKSSEKISSFEKSKIIKRIKKMGFTNKEAINYVLVNLDEKIDMVSNFINKEPVNATASYNEKLKKFEIEKEVYGKKLDREKLYNDIVNAIQKTNNVEVEAKVLDISPKFLKTDIQKALKLQGVFSTNYSSSTKERKDNIMLAVKNITNTELLPNETFSFNKLLGKRTSERGFKMSYIIMDGEFVKGIGGGICQVSSTLYNALLLSNIDVLEAHKHSLPVSYVSPGFDAMVSWDSSDLKFKNTTDLPIYIIGVADGEKLTFKIYGDTNKENYKITETSEIIKKIKAEKDEIIPDSEGKYSNKIMFKGEYLRVKPKKDGYEVKTYLNYYKDGKLAYKKELRHATYEAQNGVIYEGVESLPEGMRLPKDKFTKKPF